MSSLSRSSSTVGTVHSAGAQAQGSPQPTHQQTRRERNDLLNKRLALLLAEMDSINDDDDEDEDGDEEEGESRVDSLSLLGRSSAAVNVTDLDDWGENDDESLDDDLISCSSVARSMVANFSTVADGMVGGSEEGGPSQEEGAGDGGGQSTLRAIHLIQRFMLRHVLPNCRTASSDSSPAPPLTSSEDNDAAGMAPPTKGAFPVPSHIGEEQLPHSPSESDIPEPVLNALRILQNRFRFARLRRQVNERDRDQAIRRLQELWRRRREVNLHFQAMRRGKEHAAARDIQLAFRAAMSRRQVSSPTEALIRAKPPPTQATAHPVQQHRRRDSSDSSNDLPLCIICMTNPVGIALLPCGHAHVCGDCGQHLRRCPSCRRRIALQIRIYL
jgi:hypothetical protein